MVYDINKYLNKKKCGPDLLAAFALGGTSLVGGIGSALIGSSASNQALTSNLEENQRNRDFNAEEAQKNRDWQSDQWQHQFDTMSSEWYRQYGETVNQWYNQQNFLNQQWKQQQDYSNAQSYQYWLKQQQFNSPAAMVGRLNSAGLNAAAAINAQQFGGTGLSAAPTGSMSAPVASPSVPSPSTPSGSAASVGLSNPVQASNSADAFKNIVSGISQMVSAFAGARKDNIEAVKAEKTLTTFINQSLADLQNKELLNEYQQLQNVFFSKSAPKQLQKLGEEINLITAKVLLTNSEHLTKLV